MYIMWQNLTRLELRVSECQPVRHCHQELQVCCSLHVKLFMLLLSLIIWIASLTLISCCCLLCKLFQLEYNKQFSYCARYAVNLTLLQNAELVLVGLIWIVSFLSLFVSNQSEHMHFILGLTLMDCPGLLSHRTAIVFFSSRCQCQLRLNDHWSLNIVCHDRHGILHCATDYTRCWFSVGEQQLIDLSKHTCLTFPVGTLGDPTFVTRYLCQQRLA